MKLVRTLKAKEDKTLEACISSMNNISALSNAMEENSMGLVDKLMNMEQTPSRDEAIKYFKTQLGGNSMVRLKVKEIVDELEEMKKKRSEDVETLQIA